jgi:1,4-alpha-glucan branching enzyme
VLHLNEGDKVLAYHRWDKGGPGDDVMIVINFANKVQSDYVLNFPTDGTWKVRFNSSWKGYSSDFDEMGVAESIAENGRGKLDLAPYSAIILSQDG